MTTADSDASRTARRNGIFGVVFMVIGLCFMVYGAWHLLEIYSRPAPMFDLEEGLSPEKGMMWAKCLAGGSVAIMGLLMLIKAKMDGRSAGKSD